MIIFMLCLLFGIILICAKFSYKIDDDVKNILCIYGILIIFLSLGIFISARYNNNPEISDYQKLKINYEYVIKNDSIPIELKYNIYKDLKKYNEQVEENLLYHNDIWIGFLYPESSYKLEKFDLNKIN